MERPGAKLALLRWRIKLRSTWRPIYWWTVLAVCLWPVALFLPSYLLKIGHHPPVGTYIAVLGGLAAAVTLRKDPPPKEKAAWILLIALVMVAEIRNLYLVDAEQAATFSSINDGLEKTKKGLDQTVTNLSIVGDKLKEVSGHVDAGVISSQQAADTAKEGVSTITGGDGFCYIELAEAFIREKHADQVETMLEVRNARILWHVSMRVVDYQAFQRDSVKLSSEDIASGKMLDLDATSTYLGDKNVGPVPLFNDIGINKAYQSDRDYIIQFWALNGAWNEEIHSRTVDGKMVKAIRVARSIFPKNWDVTKVSFKPLYERVDAQYPRENGQVKWVGYDGPKRP